MLQYDITQSSPNSVVVEVGAQYNETVEYGKVTLFIDPFFNPTHHVVTSGIVKAIPKGKCFDEFGNGIATDVRVGDKIHFHYLSTMSEHSCLYGNYYKVPYCWIFCIVRGEEIIPVGGWTLLEKAIEDGDEFGDIEVNGVTVSAKQSQSGIVTSVSKKPSTKFAVLRHIGKPLLNHEKLDVKKGEKVLLEKDCNFENNIEGKTYYTVRQSNIIGKLKQLYNDTIVSP